MDSERDAIKLYMQDIGGLGLVTPDEEVELAEGIAKGDESSRTKLINSNVRLVIKIAHDFRGLGLPILDLISEGNIGLMRAVEKFDPAKGAKFSSYSSWWIKQAMRRALANQSRTVRIPIQSSDKIRRIQYAKNKLYDRLGREPTNDEIANEMDELTSTIDRLNLNRETISLDDAITEEERGEFYDIIPADSEKQPSDEVDEKEALELLIMRMQDDKVLDERERYILIHRYGLFDNPPKTLEQISPNIHRSTERVRQLEKLALKKLQEYFNKQRKNSDSKPKQTVEAVPPKGKRDYPLKPVEDIQTATAITGSSTPIASYVGEVTLEAVQASIRARKRRINARDLTNIVIENISSRYKN